MNDILKTIQQYTDGEIDLAEVNRRLKETKAGVRLDPGKNALTEEEKRATTIGHYPEQANGFGLLDTGTGSLDKVRVKAGKLVNCHCGNMYALCVIAGKTYKVKGDTLTE